MNGRYDMNNPHSGHWPTINAMVQQPQGMVCANPETMEVCRYIALAIRPERMQDATTLGGNGDGSCRAYKRELMREVSRRLDQIMGLDTTAVDELGELAFED